MQPPPRCVPPRRAWLARPVIGPRIAPGLRARHPPIGGYLQEQEPIGRLGGGHGALGSPPPYRYHDHGAPSPSRESRPATARLIARSKTYLGTLPCHQALSGRFVTTAVVALRHVQRTLRAGHRERTTTSDRSRHAALQSRAPAPVRAAVGWVKVEALTLILSPRSVSASAFTPVMPRPRCVPLPCSSCPLTVWPRPLFKPTVSANI